MAEQEKLAWPTEPGWYWWRDCDGHIEVTTCREILGELRVWALKNHRDAHYDQYSGFLNQEDFYEYGPSEFVKVLEPPPWPEEKS